MKIVVAICGASGAELGIKFLSKILEINDITIYAILSQGAKRVLNLENNIDLNCLESKKTNYIRNIESSLEIFINKKDNLHIFSNDNLDAPIASGSFLVNGMIILPCSMNTLAKIAFGISDNLITRSALVNIKERKKLVIAPREMPLNSIMLNNMKILSDIGAIISPPMLGYYSNIYTLEDMENFLFGKWLDALGISNNIYKRWDNG